jgi:hypothetical protein
MASATAFPVAQEQVNRSAAAPAAATYPSQEESKKAHELAIESLHRFGLTKDYLPIALQVNSPVGRGVSPPSSPASAPSIGKSPSNAGSSLSGKQDQVLDDRALPSIQGCIVDEKSASLIRAKYAPTHAPQICPFAERDDGLYSGALPSIQGCFVDEKSASLIRAKYAPAVQPTSSPLKKGRGGSKEPLLPLEKIAEVIKRRRLGESSYKLAEEYHVSPQTIRDYVNYYTNRLGN